MLRLTLRNLMRPVLLRLSDSNSTWRVVDHAEHVVISWALPCTWAEAPKTARILVWMHPNSQLVCHGRPNDVVSCSVIAVVGRIGEMILKRATTAIVECGRFQHLLEERRPLIPGGQQRGRRGDAYWPDCRAVSFSARTGFSARTVTRNGMNESVPLCLSFHVSIPRCSGRARERSRTAARRCGGVRALRGRRVPWGAVCVCFGSGEGKISWL